MAKALRLALDIKAPTNQNQTAYLKQALIEALHTYDKVTIFLKVKITHPILCVFH